MATEATETEELGPIDYLVIEFPGNRFNGEIAPAMTDLIERGVVRLLDLVFIRKDTDGTITVVESDEIGVEESGPIAALANDLDGLLSQEDIEAVAEALEPGSSAGLLVWENSWAAPFANAVRRAGGQVVATGRIGLAEVLAALEAVEAQD